MWSAILYFFFQLASVSVMYQHMEDVTDVKQINKAAIWMFICNFLAMELSIFGLLAIAYVAELATASVPMLVLVQNGVGAGILTPIISILIILGAISTAVNMISGIVTRCVNAMERRMDSKEKKAKGHLARNAVFTAIFTFLAFAIAQSDDSCQERICLPRLCSTDHTVYSVCGTCDRNERERDLIGV